MGIVTVVRSDAMCACIVRVLITVILYRLTEGRNNLDTPPSDPIFQDRCIRCEIRFIRAHWKIEETCEGEKKSRFEVFCIKLPLTLHRRQNWFINAIIYGWTWQANRYLTVAIVTLLSAHGFAVGARNARSRLQNVKKRSRSQRLSR